MTHDKYILDDKGEPVVEDCLYRWGMWFETHSHNRIVNQEWVGSYKVSTVFLGLDHNWSPHGPPVLWETMVFGYGPLDSEMDRCSGTREQAEAMHQKMVDKVRKNL